MNLHLLTPEKVSGRAVNLFEKAYPNKNLFLFVNHNWGDYNDSKARTEAYTDKIIYCDVDGTLEKDIDFNQIDRIFIHYLDIPKIRFIKKHDLENKKICWICWGGDLTNLILEQLGYKMYYRYPAPLLYRLKYKFLWKYMQHPTEQCLETMDFIGKHVRYFATAFHSEFDLAKKWLPRQMSDVIHVPFFYYPIEDVLSPDLRDKWSDNKFVFVGHSASFTGNHDYSFKKIGAVNLGQRTAIVPINYMGTPWNKEHIKNLGIRHCKGRCKFLESFIPLDEYNKLMLQCDRFIFSNWRQEGWGNIQLALYMGAKVFLSKKSLLAKHLKDLGIFFEYVENLNQHTFDEDLTRQQKEENRKIISNTYSLENSTQLCAALSDI